MVTTNLAQISIVKSDEGNKIIGIAEPFILVLHQGENLFEAIMRFATDAKIKSASINGLGALDDVTVAYYQLPIKEYKTKLFSGMYELVSLQGNITLVEGKPFVHIHAALGTSDYDIIGGHIMDATVGPTAEITVIPFSSPITRKMHADIGLKLMCGMPI